MKLVESLRLIHPLLYLVVPPGTNASDALSVACFATELRDRSATVEVIELGIVDAEVDKILPRDLILLASEKILHVGARRRKIFEAFGRVGGVIRLVLQHLSSVVAVEGNVALHLRIVSTRYVAPDEDDSNVDLHAELRLKLAC